MKFIKSNGILMLLVILLHGPSSTTHELNIEIPKECQQFCDSKRPKRKNGPYLLTCFDFDCSDISCETHKCPSTICKNGRQIFCPSQKGSYHTSSSSRIIKGHPEAPPNEPGGVDTFYIVFWTFSVFVIVGVVCALVSWFFSRKQKKKIQGYMPGGYVHAHQDEYRRPKNGGGCFTCCLEGYGEEFRNTEDENVMNLPQRKRMKSLSISIIYLGEDQDETRERHYSFDEQRSRPRMLVEDTDKQPKIKATRSTTVNEKVASVSSISVLKAPVQIHASASQNNFPGRPMELAESENN